MNTDTKTPTELDLNGEPLVRLKPLCACVYSCWNCPLKILPDAILVRLKITGVPCFVSRLDIMLSSSAASHPCPSVSIRG
jgi:hypothetical protein